MVDLFVTVVIYLIFIVVSPIVAIFGAIEAVINLWTLDRVPFGERDRDIS